MEEVSSSGTQDTKLITLIPKMQLIVNRKWSEEVQLYSVVSFIIQEIRDQKV